GPGPGVQPVAVGEVEVEQQRLEAFPPGDGEKARHRGGRLHLVAPGGEEPCQVLREQLLVLENEYPASHDFRVSKGSATWTRRIPVLVLGTAWGISRSAASRRRGTRSSRSAARDRPRCRTRRRWRRSPAAARRRARGRAPAPDRSPRSR